MLVPNQLIARERERQLLESLYESPRANLVSITGRRRVGKTFLVESVLKGRIDFSLTGIQNGGKELQLNVFARVMSQLTGRSLKESKPANWQQAFFALEDYLQSLPTNRKAVLFFDELPWLATHRSGFLRAFDSCP